MLAALLTKPKEEGPQMALNKKQAALLQTKTINLGMIIDKAADVVIEGEQTYIDIEGYASTASKDRSSDIIDPSVWNKASTLANYNKNPIVLAYHDHKRPIGNTINLAVDSMGLRIKARIYQAADPTVFKMVAEGVLKAFSIGFRLHDLEYKAEVDAFYLTDIELHEVSIVSVPDNQDSLFSVAKSLDMSKADLKQLLVGEAADTNEDTINMTPEEMKALISQQLAEQKAQEEALKAAAAAKEAEKTGLAELVAAEVKKAVQVTGSGAEKLAADIKAALEAERSSMADVIKGFKEEIDAKSEELAAMHRSKMVHNAVTTGQAADPAMSADRQTAVLLSKVMRKSIDDTRFGKALKEKAAGFNTSNANVHIPGVHTVNDADWETEFMTQFYMDIRRDLVIEPLFRTINMNAATMRIPVVPDQGYASYIAVNNLRTSNSTAAPDQGNRPTELTLIAHKLSAADIIGMEEEEDTILPILPLIRENLARRMARSSDRSLLRGVGGTAADPIKGLASYAIDAVAETELNLATNEKLTALKLQQTRRKLGYFGMRPQDVVYIISTQGYYDLLEDPEMRKYFDVGLDRATILTGQVANVNGSPILVSDEFEVAGDGTTAALVVNMRNFVLGNLRGMTLKTDDLVKDDSMLLVATRRFGMLEMEAGAVARIKYVPGTP